MQNKSISLIALTAFLVVTGAAAQEVVAPSEKTTNSVSSDKTAADSLSDFSADVSQKKTVDFPPRSSLGTMELAPLPGIYETDMNGPQPMGESVSPNDPPSEQLLGRLTPEVFQEMADMERDTAYLQLQLKKQELKNSLEDARKNYRAARLDEIENREKVIRSRIQWWQEQEKLRQEMEKQRQEAEEAKNKLAEAEALKAQQKAEAANQQVIDENQIVEEVPEDQEPVTPAVAYSLVNIKGTRGTLTARVKNMDTNEEKNVKIGDSLNGETVTDITPDSVVLDRNGTDYTIQFPN